MKTIERTEYTLRKDAPCIFCLKPDPDDMYTLQTSNHLANQFSTTRMESTVQVPAHTACLLKRSANARRFGAFALLFFILTALVVQFFIFPEPNNFRLFGAVLLLSFAITGVVSMIVYGIGTALFNYKIKKYLQQYSAGPG